MIRSLSLCFVAAIVACAPAPAPAVVTPELLDHAPRYRLVSPRGTDLASIKDFSAAVQQELALRGMLLAAPWETPTLQVSIASTAVRVRYEPAFAAGPTMQRAGCSGASYDSGHCTPLDGPSLVPSQGNYLTGEDFSLRIQEIGSGSVLFDRSALAPAPARGIPMYRYRLLAKQVLGGFSL